MQSNEFWNDLQLCPRNNVKAATRIIKQAIAAKYSDLPSLIQAAIMLQDRPDEIIKRIEKLKQKP